MSVWRGGMRCDYKFGVLNSFHYASWCTVGSVLATTQFPGIISKLVYDEAM